MSRIAKTPKRVEWRNRLSRFSHSKLSVTAFCRQENVSDASFYHWRRRLSDAELGVPRREDQATFIPVQVTASGSIEVSFPNGVRLAIGTHDPELVKMSIELVARVDTTRVQSKGGA